MNEKDYWKTINKKITESLTKFLIKMENIKMKSKNYL